MDATSHSPTNDAFKRPCTGCRALIWMVTTTAGKRMPLDLHPHPTGNVIATANGDAVTVLRKGADPGPDVVRWMPHHATCPQVAQFRRPAKGGR